MRWLPTVFVVVVPVYWVFGSMMVADVAEAKGLSVPLACACVLFLPLAMWYFHALPSKRRTA